MFQFAEQPLHFFIILLLGLPRKGHLSSKTIDLSRGEGSFHTNFAARHPVQNQCAPQPLATAVERVGNPGIGGEVCSCPIKIEL